MLTAVFIYVVFKDFFPASPALQLADSLQNCLYNSTATAGAMS